MVIFYLSVICLYCLFVLFVIVFWERNEVIHTTDSTVSVIVIVRNEEKNIDDLLQCFAKQKYPEENLEILIVNDNSEDNTLSILQSSSLKNLKVLELEAGEGSAKKRGIELAVAHAKGEYLLFTDGDCVVGDSWVVNLVSYAKEKKSDFLCAPVLYNKLSGWLSNVQFVEMFSLVGVTGATIRAGYPTMSNGANMLVRKERFLAVDGYGSLKEVISGDDELLMHKLFREGHKVDYFANNEVIVRTDPNPTLKALLQQRRRWGSKWKNYQLPYVKTLAVCIAFVNLTMLLGLAGSVMGFLPWQYLLESLVVKAVLEFYMMNQVAKSLDEPRLSKGSFLIAFVMYPFYVVAIAILSNLKGFEWKGRRY